MTSRRVKLTASLAFAAVIFLVLLWILACDGDSMAWLSTVFGLAAGWPAGMLASPYQSERVRFEKIGNVVAGFLAGWAVSKFDQVFALWVDPTNGPLLLDPTFSKRALLCLTAFLLAATVTYVGRKYFSWGPGSEREDTTITNP